ncbi:hypothetical protein BHE74_00006226 [Ensete ventricosum]|uniref:Uncharacterized protein n=1 Tax=Ensete ventricosum TaxID=4639 RepID=A0A444DRY2_ENSVE|nr:hypothetical protein B296_00022786 [Ensete ventricosum]RWW00923.1 hypothetical protein GW17_00036077 [Ensete ventricosum]RWW85122.1 hypothetical protein BHE74_00006226 [Ensete ventricosum]RZS13588.1 hypothetical protein BHM03_00045192 [Ensete ventricosum]
MVERSGILISEHRIRVSSSVYRGSAKALLAAVPVSKQGQRIYELKLTLCYLMLTLRNLLSHLYSMLLIQAEPAYLHSVVRAGVLTRDF